MRPFLCTGWTGDENGAEENGQMMRKMLIVSLLMLSSIALLGGEFLDDKLNYSFEYGSSTQVYVSGLRNSDTTDVTIPTTVEYEFSEYDSSVSKYVTKRRTCTVTRIKLGDVKSLRSVTIKNGWTEISDFAFQGCSGLTSVTIPDSVTIIGVNSFKNCIGLKNLTMPGNVTAIKQSAFESSGIRSITIPDSVTVLADYAFYCCSGLTNVVIGSGVAGIGTRVFTGCGVSGQLLIPDTVKHIGYEAFRECSVLSSLTIPGSVTNVGNAAFMSSSSLTNVVLSDGVTCIGESAFSCCDALKSVRFPNNAVDIGNGAFNSCDGLVDVTIPSGSIGDRAFANCFGLESVTLGFGVTSIWTSAFYNCRTKKPIEIDFKGVPPQVEKSTSSFSSYSGLVGTYPLIFKSQWESEMGSTGWWRGIKMQICDEYTIRYEANNSSGFVTNITVAAGTEYTIEGFEVFWEKHYFNAWALEKPDGTIEECTPGTTITVEGDIVCKGEWLEIHTVKFDPNDAPLGAEDHGTMIFYIEPASQDFISGKKQKLWKNEYTLEWYDFDGWEDRKDNKRYADEEEIEVDSDKTLYAIWKKHQDYILKFNANGGTGTIPDMSLSYEERISLPDPKNNITREGYAFVGWGLEEDLDFMIGDRDAILPSGREWWVGDESLAGYPQEDEITLHAIWVEDVTIEFDFNGGEGDVDRIRVSYGEDATLPVPEKRGSNEFLGWATDKTVDLETAICAGQNLSEIEGFYPKGPNGFSPQKFIGRISSRFGENRYDPKLKLYAIWTTTVKYSFYNEKLWDDESYSYSITRLNPSELSEHLYWKYQSGLGAQGVSVWERAANDASAELYPGRHLIKFECDGKYEWLADVSRDAKTGDIDGGEIRLTVDASKSAMHEFRAIKPKNNPGKMGHIWFRCEKEIKIGNESHPSFTLSRVRVFLQREDGEIISGEGGKDAWISEEYFNSEWLLCPKGKYKLMVTYLPGDMESCFSHRWAPKYYWRDITVDCEESDSLKSKAIIKFVLRKKQTNMTQTWLEDHPTTAVAADGDIETAAVMPAANGCRTVGECYALGIDPEDPDDDLKITDFKMEAGKPVITLNHTEDGSGNSFLPRVKTLGKATLSDTEEWRDVPEEGDDTMRFFKVEVEMP